MRKRRKKRLLKRKRKRIETDPGRRRRGRTRPRMLDRGAAWNWRTPWSSLERKEKEAETWVVDRQKGDECEERGGSIP